MSRDRVLFVSGFLLGAAAGAGFTAAMAIAYQMWG